MQKNHVNSYIDYKGLMLCFVFTVYCGPVDKIIYHCLKKSARGGTKGLSSSPPLSSRALPNSYTLIEEQSLKSATTLSVPRAEVKGGGLEYDFEKGRPGGRVNCIFYGSEYWLGIGILR